VKIQKLTVNSTNNLSIEPIQFHSLTLLVGVSGSGKSQVLHYIKELTQLLETQTVNTLEDGDYTLDFEFENHLYSYQVTIQNHQMITQDLSSKEGALAIPLQIKTINHEIRYVLPVSLIRQQKFKKENFNFSSHNTVERLAYINQFNPERFDIIKGLYQLIFEEIEDIKFEEINKHYVLLIKLTSGDSIPYYQLSDGMLKTLLYLTEVTSAKPGTILLIDEFENGLGLNCLGLLLEEMIQKQGIQMILTSHHPYIINNILPSCWVIMYRIEATVINKTAIELGIGQTKYDAFFELMNRLEYEGVF
jgi:predicted ATPase